jgi:hypothetical protein
MQDLHGDGTVVLDVASEEDGGHATSAKLTLDRVRPPQCLLKPGQEVAHRRAETDDIDTTLHLDRGLEYMNAGRGSPASISLWVWRIGNTRVDRGTPAGVLEHRRSSQWCEWYDKSPETILGG